MNGNRVHTHTGFTIIEIVATAGIFLIVIVLVLNLYVVFSRAQRSAGSQQKIIGEVGFLMEKMAQEIRLNEIIYSGALSYNATSSKVLYSLDGDGGIQGSEVELALTNAVGRNIYYLFDDGSNVSLACRTGRGLYRYDRTTITDCQKLLDIPQLEMVDAGFYIVPGTNPYPDSNSDCGTNSTFNGYFCTCTAGSNCASGSCGQGRCVLPNQQPRVTWFLKIRNHISGKDMVVESSSSGRVYKR